MSPGGCEGVGWQPQGILWGLGSTSMLLLELLEAQRCTGGGCLPRLSRSERVTACCFLPACLLACSACDV